VKYLKPLFLNCIDIAVKDVAEGLGDTQAANGVSFGLVGALKSEGGENANA
jgi:Ni/Fe-hydrogenase subunit HybB-like protein